jgi:hypothetical protein
VSVLVVLGGGRWGDCHAAGRAAEGAAGDVSVKPRKSYAELLKDPRWQKKRLEILNRDLWKCRICGASNKTLHVDHKEYTKGADPWEYADYQLQTLCKDCHAGVTAVRRTVSLVCGHLSLEKARRLEGYALALICAGHDISIDADDDTCHGVADALRIEVGAAACRISNGKLDMKLFPKVDT